MSRVQQRLSGLQKAGYVDPDDERIQKGQRQLIEESAKWKGPGHKERQQEREVRKAMKNRAKQPQEKASWKQQAAGWFFILFMCGIGFFSFLFSISDMIIGNGVVTLDVQDTAKLKKVLFGGDPWLVYCINDETVNHRLPQILEESARSLWRSLGLSVGILRCWDQTSSGRSVAQRFSLSLKPPLSFVVANGNKPRPLHLTGISKVEDLEKRLKPALVLDTQWGQNAAPAETKSGRLEGETFDPDYATTNQQQDPVEAPSASERNPSQGRPQRDGGSLPEQTQDPPLFGTGGTDADSSGSIPKELAQEGWKQCIRHKHMRVRLEARTVPVYQTMVLIKFQQVLVYLPVIYFKLQQVLVYLGVVHVKLQQAWCLGVPGQGVVHFKLQQVSVYLRIVPFKLQQVLVYLEVVQCKLQQVSVYLGVVHVKLQQVLVYLEVVQCKLQQVSVYLGVVHVKLQQVLVYLGVTLQPSRMVVYLVAVHEEVARYGLDGREDQGHDRGLAVDVIVQTDPMPAMPDPYVTLCFSGDRRSVHDAEPMLDVQFV
ncbi:SYP42 [Symbiodinium microadriaticum]|nr:SYP42 [Symbiodinium microadriaticum]